MAKVITPIHCGQPTKQYVKVYGLKVKHSIESGFKCVVCGQIRVPDISKPFDRSDMDKMDAIREAGIKFDESLSCN